VLLTSPRLAFQSPHFHGAARLAASPTGVRHPGPGPWSWYRAAALRHRRPGCGRPLAYRGIHPAGEGARPGSASTRPGCAATGSAATWPVYVPLRWYWLRCIRAAAQAGSIAGRWLALARPL